MPPFVLRAARVIVALELPVVLIVAATFWFPNPERIYALCLLPLLFIARLIARRRLWTPTPIDGLLMVFLVLGVANLINAPYMRGAAVLGRPLMGIALALTFADFARARGVRFLATLTIGLALLVGVLGITASQWSVKSDLFQPFLNSLPDIRWFPGAEGGFNVNEIGGALVFLAPLAAALVLVPIDHGDGAGGRWRRYGAVAAFVLLVLALFFGQSRFALFGLIVALAVIIFTLVPAGTWRRLALVGLVAFTALEMAIFAGVFTPVPSAITQRDEDSIASRLYIWASGIQIVRDFPLTGTGMNTFRIASVRALYPVIGYDRQVLPHAHNEFVQIGADLGIPGVIVFAGWYAAAGWMVWRVWRSGSALSRAMAIGAGAGLLAHGVFGLGDAIALWDRFTFLFWWTLGIGMAAYTHTRAAFPVTAESTTPRQPSTSGSTTINLQEKAEV